MNNDYTILDIKTNKYIKNVSYKIIPKSMAKIIKTLNQKGYRIIKLIPADVCRYQVFEILNLDDKNILNEKVLKNICYTYILIQFHDKCSFNSTPEGFYWSKDFNLFIGNINYYEENPFRLKSLEDLDKEIKEKYNILEKWANSLPDIIERNDENE